MGSEGAPYTQSAAASWAELAKMDAAGDLEDAPGTDPRRAAPTLGGDFINLEVTVVAEGAWRVSDLRVPADDVSHVVAFIESRDDSFEIVWLRGSIAVPPRFDTIDRALDAIEDVLAKEGRDASGTRNDASPEL